MSQACRRLPARIREERYQEWLAELPVILHDRDAGPAPLRMVRMLAFAAGTLRGTTLAPGAYRGAHRGAHRGGSVKTIRWLATGLLLLGALLCAPLFLLAWEGYIIDQLITGGGVAVGATLALTSLACFTAIRIRKRRHTAAADWWETAAGNWYSTGKVAAEPACWSGPSPASPAGATRCCSRSSATAATRSRPSAWAWPWR